MNDNDNPFDDLFFWINLAFFDFGFSKKSGDKSINMINVKTNNLYEMTEDNMDTSIKTVTKNTNQINLPSELPPKVNQVIIDEEKGTVTLKLASEEEIQESEKTNQNLT